MPKKCFLSHRPWSPSLLFCPSASPPTTASVSLEWWEKSPSRNSCLCECCLVRQSHITRLQCVHMCLSVGVARLFTLKSPERAALGLPALHGYIKWNRITLTLNTLSLSSLLSSHSVSFSHILFPMQTSSYWTNCLRYLGQFSIILLFFVFHAAFLWLMVVI